MPAPKRPNTVNASTANRRRGDRTAADRLVRHGWLVLAPEVLEGLDPELVAALRNVQGDVAGRRSPVE